MSINLQKEHIRLSEALCSHYCRTTAESDIIVPDVKPDIAKVLQLSGEVFINQKNVQTDRVFVQGTVRLNILYIPEDGESGPVKSIDAVQEFNHSIDIKGAKPGMTPVCDAECETPEFTLINSRKINVRSKIGISIKLNSVSEVDIATDTEGTEAVQLKGRSFKVQSAGGDAERDILLKEELELPQGKAHIGEILRLTAQPTVTDLKILDNRAIIKGEIKFCTIYCGEDPSPGIEATEHTVSFAETPEIDGFSEGMEGEVELCVKDIYSEIRRDSDGDKTLIGIELTLSAQLRAYETVEFSAIEDAYGLENEINIKSMPLCIEQLIDRQTTQTPLKEPVCVPDYQPELHKVLSSAATVSIEGIEVSNGSITVNGLVCCTILYMPESSGGIISLSHTIPYSTTFNVPAASQDCVCDAKAEISHLGYTINGAREMELRVIVSVSLKAMQNETLNLISDMEYNENAETAALPSMLIYFVSGDETLWDIAKRYKVTPDSIVSDNGAEKDILKPGNRIFIFRKS